MIAVRDYLAQKPADAGDLAPISILKPLAGADEGLEANLRSFFSQDHPDFELLFAVREASDPAVQVVETLCREFPARSVQFIVTGEPPYPNAKVFSLDRMLSEAKHDLLVMSDSDIRVEPGFLRAIAAEFSDPHIALATCPYRATAGQSLWSNLEAEGMNTEFLAGMLVARLVEGVKFAVGPTIAARKSALAGIGGFAVLKDYLAEDFVMGKFAAAAGFGRDPVAQYRARTISEAKVCALTPLIVCAGPAARGDRGRSATWARFLPIPCRSSPSFFPSGRPGGRHCSRRQCAVAWRPGLLACGSWAPAPAGFC